jgi:hypothetical protein
MTISWSVFVNINKKEDCSKVVEQIGKMLETPLFDVVVEKYDKGDIKHKITAKSALPTGCGNSVCTTEMPFYVLKEITKLCSVWTIGFAKEDYYMKISGSKSKNYSVCPGVQEIYFEFET